MADIKINLSGNIDKEIGKLKNTVTKVVDKVDNVNKLRREASRLASKANKRVQRLEKAGLKDAPAYKRYIKDGGAKFGIRGKSFNQVQSEMARLNRFLNSETSTVRGVNRVLKDMAKNTGIKYTNLKNLRKQSAKFFELASKVEQYLRTVDDMASATGYQKIWEAINTYTKTQSVNLADGRLDIDQMVSAVTGALKEYDTPVNLPDGGGWYIPK